MQKTIFRSDIINELINSRQIDDSISKLDLQVKISLSMSSLGFNENKQFIRMLNS